MSTTTAVKTSRHRSKEPRRSKPEVKTEKLSGYKEQAEEIAEAKQAMLRLNRGVEFEPERLHYVISIHSL